MNRPADHTSPDAVSDGLFDLPADQPSSGALAHPRAAFRYVPTNDLALIRQVLDRATDPGYVLIGPSHGVWRRRVRRGAEVDRATPAEANAVRQLLDRGFLCLGGVRPAQRC